MKKSPHWGFFRLRVFVYCYFIDFYGLKNKATIIANQRLSEMRDFSVTILGSSAALPYKNRNLTSQIVNYAGRLFLIDCGEGTQMQLMKLKVKFMRIHHIFISHLHGDHFYGLIGLVSTFHLLGRKEDLHIYGPPMLEQILTLQLEASLTILVYKVVYHQTNDFSAEILFEDEKISIASFPMSHRIPTTGFLFAEKQHPRHINLEATEKYKVPYISFNDLKAGNDFLKDDGTVVKNNLLTIEPEPPRSFAFCSDTVYHNELAGRIQGCNLLYHEATFMSDMAEVAKAKMHSTSAEAATVARQSGAGKLLIGHFSARYDNLLPLLEEARSVFPETYLAEEGKTYQV